jgi:hypothetical protein
VSLSKAKADFKQRLFDVLSEFEQRTADTAPPEYLGAGSAKPLEHVTRRHVVDHIVESLGWSLARMNADMIEEARIRGETTLFLDYLGVAPQARLPRVIVEAKAWAKPIVRPSIRGEGALGDDDMTHSATQLAPIEEDEVLAELLASAIKHHKNGGLRERSPVSLEWTDWLATLQQYVMDIHATSGHVVSRVVITSGRWLVIFTDPETTFLKRGEVSTKSIAVFIGSKMIDGSDRIFDLLARSGVIDELPPWVRPSRLPAFTSTQDVARIFRALWVTRVVEGPHFQRHPQLTLNVALVIVRYDGMLVTVLDDQLPYRSVPYDQEDLAAHLGEIRRLSDQLLAQTCEELGKSFTPSNVAHFPGFPKRYLGEKRAFPVAPGEFVNLLDPWQQRPGEFLLVLGAQAHFLRERPEVVSCGFHEWAVSREHHQSQGLHPITGRSVEPAAFFYTGEQHHCAHRLVHDRRDGRCQISAFEEFLCCRACTLQSFCWNEADLAGLPCGTVLARAHLAVSSEPSDSSGEAA